MERFATCPSPGLAAGNRLLSALLQRREIGIYNRKLLARSSSLRGSKGSSSLSLFALMFPDDVARSR